MVRVHPGVPLISTAINTFKRFSGSIYQQSKNVPKGIMGHFGTTPSSLSGQNFLPVGNRSICLKRDLRSTRNSFRNIAADAYFGAGSNVLIFISIEEILLASLLRSPVRFDIAHGKLNHSISDNQTELEDSPDGRSFFIIVTA